MNKRPSLFATKDKTEPASAASVVSLERAAAAEAKPAGKASGRPPSRAGKRVVSTYVSAEAWKQLRMLSLDTGQSTQALGEEAFNLLFQKYRLNRIA